MTKHYHSAMIGTGQATPMLAVALAGRGEQVAVIEGHLVGGSCVNARLHADQDAAQICTRRPYGAPCG